MFFCWILLCPADIFSQEDVGPGDKLSQQQFVLGCEAYRQNVIHDLEEVLTEFTNLSDSLVRISENPQAHYAFKEMVLKGSLMDCHDKTTDAMYGAIRNFGFKDSIASGSYEQWLDENLYSLMELQFLISNGILEANYPYQLGDLTKVWKEFSFFGIEANMSVADIGAGNGVISFILLGSGLPLNVVMTEIDEDYLALLKTKIIKYGSGNQLSSISLIKGTDNDLGLGDLKVDRMILREVFHHLKDTDSILEDISLHLKPDGYLIVEESTKELTKNGEKSCNKATTYKKIMKEFGAAGYDLEGLEVVGSFYMLRFKHSG